MNFTSMRRPGLHSQHSSRDGIILLVVLGMLTLFSMLAVSYLVFTSRQKSAAFNINRAEATRVDGDALVQESLMRILVGSNGPESSLWGHDLLGDLYGMRDGVESTLTLPATFTYNDSAPAALLDGNFLRFPTELYRAPAGTSNTYPNRREDNASQRDYPLSPTPSFPIDDTLTGRLLTFQGGPLEGLTMTIVRYFGDHSQAGVPQRRALSGQVVVDVRPYLETEIEYNGVTRRLREWIESSTFAISNLFYDGPATTGSSAQPYASFYINGRILNGPGIGWDVARQRYLPADPNSLQPDPADPTTFNLNDVVSTTLDITTGAGSPRSGNDFATPNGTDVPVSMQGHYSLYRRERDPGAPNALLSYLQDLPPGDVDEPFDAPTMDDLWLSYFPNDSDLGVAAPSFVRPGLINWIINQKGNLNSLSQPERTAVLTALQRSTLRPIPIRPDPSGSGTGVLQLDYSNFTGGNPAFINNAAMRLPLNPSTVSAAALEELARVLAGRDSDGDGNVDTWDVDTDGDGVVDSVWIDAGLPLNETAEGRLVKPLVAYKIEDLGGRVNINLAGNVAQAWNQMNDIMQGPIQQTGATATPSASGNDPTTYQRNGFPVGFGYGPADIDLRALFTNTYAPSPASGPRRVMSDRYTRIELNLPSPPFTNPYPFYSPGEPYLRLTNSPNDILGALRYPSRQNLHAPHAIFGLPYDPFGRVAVGLGVDGGLLVNRSRFPVAFTGPSLAQPTGGQVNDDPYEIFESTARQPDATYTYSDLEPVLRFSDFDRDQIGSRLLDLINQYHSNPTAVPDQLEAVRKILADSITTTSKSAAVAVGPLPSEWRRNAVVAQSAFSPQSLFRPGLTSPTNDTQRNELMWQLLAPELRAGRKFDLNRPFGNGRDDDSDGVIDDPQEVASLAESFFGPSPSPYETNRSDVTPGEPGRNSRELYARYLYFMAMSLIRDAANNTEFDFPNNYMGSGTFLYGLTFEEEYRAWKVAQWAVNVVDYRDHDAIMTRFNYDPQPFDGWDVDLTTPGSFRTVWGMEYPELTLEESLAFHDRRVRDTSDDTSGQKRLSGGSFQDDDPDQWRIPQGSLFLELRATRSSQQLLANTVNDNQATRPAVPPELYTRVTHPYTGQDEYVLDLGREAPGNNPVWRVVISEIHEAPQNANPERCPDFLLKPAGSLVGSDTSAGGVDLNRDTATMEPNQPDFFVAPVGLDTVVDRVIWFTNRDPDANRDGAVDFAVPSDSSEVGRIFFNRLSAANYAPVTGGGVYLRGGQYAVIGPRPVTPIGSLDEHSASGITHDAGTDEPLVDYSDYESPHRIGITAAGVVHQNVAGFATTPTVDGGVSGASDGATIQPTLGIIAAAKPPINWGATTAQIGVNISEPLPIANGLIGTPPHYYPQPTESLHPGNNFPVDSWRDYDNDNGELPDAPFDSQAYSELQRAFGAVGENTGTRTHFKTAYLQRLADPTLPYNATDNPYRTVDYIALDLTVFNGSMTNDQLTDSTGAMEWRDEGDPNPYGTAPVERFASRYKTGNTWDEDATAAGAQFANLLHSVNTYPPEEHNQTAVNNGGNIPYFSRVLHLDPAVDPDQGGNPDQPANRNQHSTTLGYLNASFGRRWAQGPSGNSSMTRFVGLPYNDFGSNVLWLNRDFMSPKELAWVPTSSPGRFAAEFGIASAASGLTATDPYDDSNNAAANTSGRYDYNQQFPHLWNYLSSNANDFAMSPNFWRVLDWVEVPTPFDFELDFLSPNRDVITTPVPIFPPNINYNLLGTNVTGNPASWNNTMSGSLPTNPAFWLNVITTETLRPPFNMWGPQYRNGRINPNTIKNKNVYRALMYGFSTTTERSADGAFWSDFKASRQGFTGTGPATYLLNSELNSSFPTQMAGAFKPSVTSDIGPTTNLRQEPIESTSMRKVTGADRMLFRRDPMQAPILGSEAQSHERSVVHQQLGLTRLDNLMSPQSNVFGVWITVGMFEVDPSNLQVGNEVGADTGQIKRYRSFHIIDRSVPVMYRTGETNNVEGVIQLSRILN